MIVFRRLVLREFWEHRAIWIVPSSIGGLLVLGALFGRAEIAAGAMQAGGNAAGGLLLFVLGLPFLLAMSVYCAWYLLDCLHADRKDRSILFWKSMPISDAETVLAKLAMGLLVIPLVYFATADLTTLLMAFIISIRASSWIGNGLWRPDTWLQLQALWLYVIATLALWFLPVAGWLMLVSASANRATALWSLLPPLALIWAERIFFGSHAIAGWLSNRLLFGYVTTAFHGGPEPATVAVTAVGGDRFTLPINAWQAMNPWGFLGSPATWVGAAIGAALIAAAIRLRSRSTEIQ